MPKTKLERFSKPAVRRDPVKGLILEYKTILNLTHAECAEKMGVSPNTFTRHIQGSHSDEWLSDALKFCRSVGVPIEEFRAAIRY